MDWRVGGHSLRWWCNGTWFSLFLPQSTKKTKGAGSWEQDPETGVDLGCGSIAVYVTHLCSTVFSLLRCIRLSISIISMGSAITIWYSLLHSCIVLFASLLLGADVRGRNHGSDG